MRKGQLDATRCRQKATPVTGSFQPRLTGLPGDRGRGKILTGKNLAGYRRAQQHEGQIRGGDVSYVDTKKASELLGRSGLQLPRVPSLNTDRAKILTEKNLAGYRRAQQETGGPGQTATGGSKPRIGWGGKIGKSGGIDRLCSDGVIICRTAARCGLRKAIASTLRKKWGSEASPGVQTGVHKSYENL